MNIKKNIKRLIKNLFLLIVFPIYASFIATRALTRNDQCFTSYSQALSLVPGRVGSYCRAAFYRMCCPQTSDDIVVGFLTVLSHRNTTIRRGVYIGPQCNIGMCEIGEETLIGSGVHILSGNQQHIFSDLETPIQQQGGSFKKIRIGEDCWLGNASTIMSDLAPKSIVAAGSVLTKSFAPGSILAGNPARIIGNRFKATHPEGDIHV